MADLVYDSCSIPPMSTLFDNSYFSGPSAGSLKRITCPDLALTRANKPNSLRRCWASRGLGKRKIKKSPVSEFDFTSSSIFSGRYPCWTAKRFTFAIALFSLSLPGVKSRFSLDKLLEPQPTVKTQKKEIKQIFFIDQPHEYFE